MSDLSERLQTSRNRTLSNRVGSLAGEMLPGENHDIQLRGAYVPPLGIRQFEQVFDRSLDLNTGVNMKLSLDPDSRKITVDRLAFAIPGEPMTAILERTEGLGYMPWINQHDKGPVAAHIQTTDYTSDELLGALAISQPDATNTEAFRLWRADLLSKSNGWRIDEFSDFTQDIDPTFTVDADESVRQRMIPGIITYVRVLHSEAFRGRNNDSDISHESLDSVAQIIEATLPSTSEDDRDSLHFYTLAEVRSNDYDRQPVSLSRKVFQVNNSLENHIAGTAPRLLTDDVEDLNFHTFNKYLHIVDFADRAMRRAKSTPTQL